MPESVESNVLIVYLVNPMYNYIACLITEKMCLIQAQPLPELHQTAAAAAAAVFTAVTVGVPSSQHQQHHQLQQPHQPDYSLQH